LLDLSDWPDDDRFRVKESLWEFQMKSASDVVEKMDFTTLFS